VLATLLVTSMKALRESEKALDDVGTGNAREDRTA
jgi:hypothetical protein